MARLYGDENFPYPVVLALRRLGHDVLTAQEAGKARQKIQDAMVLADATADGRAILTHNRKDFIHLHNQQPNHSGIIVCTIDLDFEGVADRIDAEIRLYPELTNRLIRVNRPRAERA